MNDTNKFLNSLTDDEVKSLTQIYLKIQRIKKNGFGQVEITILNKKIHSIVTSDKELSVEWHKKKI